MFLIKLAWGKKIDTLRKPEITVKWKLTIIFNITCGVNVSQYTIYMAEKGHH